MESKKFSFSSEVCKWIEEWAQTKPDAQIKTEQYFGSYRVDIVLTRGNAMFLIEVDENEHKTYDTVAEMDRMCFIQRRLKSCQLPCAVIRYNPSVFSIGEHFFKYPPIQRKNALLHFLDHYSPQQNFEVHYAFFSTDENGQPLIWSHPDFDHDICKHKSVLQFDKSHLERMLGKTKRPLINDGSADRSLKRPAHGPQEVPFCSSGCRRPRMQDSNGKFFRLCKPCIDKRRRYRDRIRQKLASKA